MSKYTPGPWFALPGAYRALSVDHEPGAFSIGDAPNVETANILCSRFAWEERRDEMEANARLMAAAPDLLEALQDMVIDHESLSPATIAFARAAIAKALGEPQ